METAPSPHGNTCEARATRPAIGVKCSCGQGGSGNPAGVDSALSIRVQREQNITSVPRRDHVRKREIGRVSEKSPSSRVDCARSSARHPARRSPGIDARHCIIPDRTNENPGGRSEHPVDTTLKQIECYSDVRNYTHAAGNQKGDPSSDPPPAPQTKIAISELVVQCDF